MAAASERWRVLARAGEIEYDRVLLSAAGDQVPAEPRQVPVAAHLRRRVVLRRLEPADEEPGTAAGSDLGG